MDFYCFSVFLISLHQSYTVFLTKSGWLWKDWASVVRWLCKEPGGVMWQLELLVSEKLSKQLWFQLHSDTVFVLLKDGQNTRSDISLCMEILFSSIITTKSDENNISIQRVLVVAYRCQCRHARVTTRATRWAVLQKERSTGIVLTTLLAPGQTRLKHHRQTSLCENIYIILH